MTAFPAGFLWGAATAGHQVEGGNVNADIWPLEWAKPSLFAEPSGDACDHYHRYQEDIALLAGLGSNAYRFSLEWARIEPEDGWFSRAALDHYRRMLATCHEHGVTPVVTYNHFVTPRWFAGQGGWASPDAASRFARFASAATKHIGDLLSWACTLNEPNLMRMLQLTGVSRWAPARRASTPHRRTPPRLVSVATTRPATAWASPVPTSRGWARSTERPEMRSSRWHHTSRWAGPSPSWTSKPAPAVRRASPRRGRAHDSTGST